MPSSSRVLGRLVSTSPTTCAHRRHWVSYAVTALETYFIRRWAKDKSYKEPSTGRALGNNSLIWSLLYLAFSQTGVALTWSGLHTLSVLPLASEPSYLKTAQI